MIKLLLKLFNWLDKRFPSKFYVNEEIYQGLTDRIHGHTKTLASLSNKIDDLTDRIKSLEKSNAAIKEALGGYSPALKSEANRLREEFIKGKFEEFMNGATNAIR